MTWRDSQVQRFLKYLLDASEGAMNQMAGKTPLEWAQELGIPPHFPSPHAAAEDPDKEVFAQFVCSELERVGFDYDVLRSSDRLTDGDWESAYSYADEVIALAALDLVKGRGLEDVRNHVASMHADAELGRKAQQMPAYNKKRSGNKSWYS